MKKLLVILGVLLFVGNGVLAQHLKLLTPPVMNLGTIPSDTVISTVIRFTNDGEAPLKIKKVETSCGCTIAKPEKLEIQPGEESQVHVTFNSKGYRGLVHKYVTFETENGEPRNVRVTLTMRVRERIEIEPRFLDFRQVVKNGGSTALGFFIKNNSNQKLKVKKIEVPVSIYSVSPRKFEVTPGDSVRVQVTVESTRSGRFDDVLLIHFDKPKGLIKRVPVFLEVKEN
jgi:uncharacterized cupredoxin-like copper-binding protein